MTVEKNERKGKERLGTPAFPHFAFTASPLVCSLRTGDETMKTTESNAPSRGWVWRKRTEAAETGKEEET